MEDKGGDKRRQTSQVIFLQRRTSTKLQLRLISTEAVLATHVNARKF